jgi:hypothetical protein
MELQVHQELQVQVELQVLAEHQVQTGTSGSIINFRFKWFFRNIRNFRYIRFSGNFRF